MAASSPLQILLVLVLICCLIAGGLFHAVTPHRHSHDGGESGIWTMLHASLRSEEKKALAALSISLFAIFLITVSVPIPVFSYVTSRRRPERLLLLLKKGILPYRRFL